VTGDSGCQQNCQGNWEIHLAALMRSMHRSQQDLGINNQILASMEVGEGNTS
jgi:hypothetical protein